MTLTQKRAGDLIYVPSKTLIHQFGVFRSLERPVHLLITAAHSDEPKHYRVSHDGGEWFLSRSDAYEPKEERSGS